MNQASGQLFLTSKNKLKNTPQKSIVNSKRLSSQNNMKHCSKAFDIVVKHNLIYVRLIRPWTYPEIALYHDDILSANYGARIYYLIKIINCTQNRKYIFRPYTALFRYCQTL